MVVGEGVIEAAGTGLSVTPLMNALDVAVPVWAGPPVGTGQLARIQTLDVSPAVTRSGLSWTEMVCLVVVVVGRGLPVVVVVAVPVGVPGVGVEAVGVGVPVGLVSAEAEQPVRPTMTMAPAYATRLTLSTGPHPTPPSCTPASTKFGELARPDTQKIWANP
ncbi:hypothetical protein ACFQ0B_04835 [Nonomuraea thailandensis]